MHTPSITSTVTRLARRTATFGVVLSLGLLAAPLAAGAAAPPAADNPPSITTVSGSGNGTINVTWQNDAAAATSLDVILYDANGNVVADHTLDPSATSDSFTGVPDGGNYTVDVTATTPAATLDAGASSPFDVFHGAYVVDAGPTLGDVTASGGTVTVTWTNNAPDATSLDAILYDANGNVVSDITLAPDATTASFVGVPDGGGYTVDVVATTPAGSLSAGTSPTFDLYQGGYVVDNPPTLGTITVVNGHVVVTWSNDAADASSVDVILYDANGTVVADNTVAADATTTTFATVADGQGYTVDIVANTPGGALDSGPSNSFDLSNGTLSNDAPPTVTAIDCTNGVVTVTWTSNASDGTGYDVQLLDANGNVLQTITASADATSASFAPVADGDGYSAQVVAHTPVGDLTGSGWTFGILNGAIAPLVPQAGPGTFGDHPPVPVDPSTVTLTPINGGLGGWTVSWPELASAPTDGYYYVTDDQGDSCTANATGVAGTVLSCTLAPRSDGTTTVTGLAVSFNPYVIMYSKMGGVNAAGSPQILSDAVGTPTTPAQFVAVAAKTKAQNFEVAPTGWALNASGRAPHSATDALLVGGALLLALFAGLVLWTSRRRTA